MTENAVEYTVTDGESQAETPAPVASETTIEVASEGATETPAPEAAQAVSQAETPAPVQVVINVPKAEEVAAQAAPDAPEGESVAAVVAETTAPEDAKVPAETATLNLVRQGGVAVLDAMNAISLGEAELAGAQVGIEDAEEMLEEAKQRKDAVDRTQLDKLRSAQGAVDVQIARLERISNRLSDKIIAAGG